METWKKNIKHNEKEIGFRLLAERRKFNMLLKGGGKYECGCTIPSTFSVGNATKHCVCKRRDAGGRDDLSKFLNKPITISSNFLSRGDHDTSDNHVFDATKCKKKSGILRVTQGRLSVKKYGGWGLFIITPSQQSENLYVIQSCRQTQTCSGYKIFADQTTGTISLKYVAETPQTHFSITALPDGSFQFRNSGLFLSLNKTNLSRLSLDTNSPRTHFKIWEVEDAKRMCDKALKVVVV